MGLFEELENGKNVYHYKKLEDGEIEELMKGVMVEETTSDPILSGSIAVLYARGLRDEEKAMKLEKRQKMNTVYTAMIYARARLGKTTTERRDKLSRMITAEDDETRDMAIKIISNL
jgi:hypothetical protein